MRSYRFFGPLAVCAVSVYGGGCSGSNTTGAGQGSHPVGTGQVVTQATGPSGGTVSLEGTTLDIPAGALSGSQSISITSTMDAAPTGVSNLSPVYKFGPDGLVFSSPITVHLTFSAGGIGHPIIVWSTLGGAGFETVPTTVEGNVATGQVSHFSEGFVADGSTVSMLPAASDDAGTDQGGDASSGGPPPYDSGTVILSADAGTGPVGSDAGTSGDGGACSVCAAGYCASSCPAGTSACGSSPAECSNLQTDANNCGSCGHSCGAGMGCSAGQCVATCGGHANSGFACGGAPSGPDGGSTLNCSSCYAGPGVTLTACGNTCVDTSSDSNNCGACGNACGSGATCQSGVCTPLCAGGAVCAGGLCALTCPAGQSECGGGGGTTAFCVDFQTDSANCGACGKTCAGGNVCRGGACVPTCGAGSSSAYGCGGASADGGATLDCSHCGPPGVTLTACGSFCTDTTSDMNNCGACGVHCGTGQVCSSGSCTSMCPSGDVCAAGACVASCPAPMQQCQSVGSGNATPMCTDVTIDSNNCGACGNVCPQGEGCSNGVCAAWCSAADASAPTADAGFASGGGTGGGPSFDAGGSSGASSGGAADAAPPLDASAGH